MATDDVQTNLRIPVDLKERLQVSAETAGRSLSAEVAFRIARAYELEAGLDQALASAELLRQQVGELREAVSRREAQHADALSRVAALEGEGRLLRDTRESDIAAATKFLSERADFLAARAGSAEREALVLSEALKSQQAQNVSSLERLKNAEAEVEELKRKLAERADVALDLAPVVVRLERDVARLEVDKAAETLTIRVIASTMRPLLDKHDDGQKLEGILDGATVAEWKGLCDAYIANKIVRRTELDAAFERLKAAESKLRVVSPIAADPMWEKIGFLRASAAEADAQLMPPSDKVLKARTRKPKR